MKTLPLLITSLLMAFGTATANEGEVKAVYSVFDKAMLDKDFEAAFDALGKESQKLLEEIRVAANTADKATLSKKPVTVITTVFSIRKTAEEPVEGALDTLKLISKNYARTSRINSLGQITVEGDAATGEMLMNGKASGMTFAFIKEGGAWKFDMATQLEEAEKMMTAPMKGSEKKRAELIDRMAEVSSSKTFDPWKPLE